MWLWGIKRGVKKKKVFGNVVMKRRKDGNRKNGALQM